jgi:hypothetical protein
MNQRHVVENLNGSRSGESLSFLTSNCLAEEKRQGWPEPLSSTI